MNKQLLAFNVMTAVQSSYTAEKMSDSEFAKKLTAILKTDVSTARVRQARAALGIRSNTPANQPAVSAVKVLLQMSLSDQDLRKNCEEFIK